MIWTNDNLLGGRASMAMVLALAVFPACGDDGAATTGETETDSEGTTEGPTTTPSTTNPSTTMNPSTSGMTGETDTETTDDPPTTGDTDTTGDPTTGDTDPTTGDTETTGDLCGNDVVDVGEECDGTDLDGQDCTTQGADEGTLACNDDCTFNVDGCIMYSCGNDTQEGTEVCDGDDLADQTCEGLAFFAGTLACSKNCMDYDTTGCVDNVCGNGTVEGPEACDGANLNGQACGNFGFIGGTLACAPDCLSLDSSGCSSTVCATPALAFGPGPLDGEVFATIDVPSVGAFVSDVDVSIDITHVWVSDIELDIRHVDTDTSVELLDDQCPNGDNVNAAFDQDGVPVVCAAAAPAVSGNVLPRGNLDNFNGMTDAAGTWELRVFDDEAPDPGLLNEWCITVGVSETDPTACGDNSAQFSEPCDGTDLRGATCVTEGFDGGTLGCFGDCSGYDTSGCSDCGDGMANGTEICDGADLGGADCVSLGFPAGGTLGCTATCTLDTAMCTPPLCGDSVLSAPENCDTREMGGSKCEDLGFEGGALDCSFPSCTYDTSECSNAIIAFCNTPGAAIVDFMTLTNTIALADAGSVADIDVFVDITHTFTADLDIVLQNGATQIDLSTDLCTSGDNVFATFNDEGNGPPNCIAPLAIEGNINPEVTLSTFDGVAIAGNWDLLVGDDAGGDIGTLNEWCIYITPE